MTVAAKPTIFHRCIDVIPGLRELATIGAAKGSIRVLAKQRDRSSSDGLIVAIERGNRGGEGVIYRRAAAGNHRIRD